MLVLTRKHNETLLIANDIVITIVRVRGDSVRIGIQAPKEIGIMRGELVGKPKQQPLATETSTAGKSLGKQKPKSDKSPTSHSKTSDKEAPASSGPLSQFVKASPKVELAIAS